MLSRTTLNEIALVIRGGRPVSLVFFVVPALFLFEMLTFYVPAASRLLVGVVLSLLVPRHLGLPCLVATDWQPATRKVVDRKHSLGLHTILPAGFWGGVRPVGSTWPGAREVPLRQDVPRPGQCR